MFTRRHLARLATWIAILAILAGAVMPSVAQLRAARPASLWAELCSVDGPKRVALADLPATPLRKSDHGQHCPFCLPHGGTIGVLASTQLSLPLAPGRSTFPPAYYQSLRPQFAWLSRQPRGPPLSA